MSKLVSSVTKLLGRDLTNSEIQGLAAFQQLHEIDDDDPLVVVLALVGANRLLMEELPGVLQQKAESVIELHSQTLREQSSLIAKELIVTLSRNIEAAGKSHRSRADQLLLPTVFFLLGIVTAMGVYLLRGH